MTMTRPAMRDAPRIAAVSFAAVVIAAAGIFAVTLGARSSLALFLGAINTSTGLGIATISLAFAVQLWWGLTQPIARWPPIAGARAAFWASGFFWCASGWRWCRW